MVGCSDDASQAPVVPKEQVSLPLLNQLDSFDNSGQARSIVVENNLAYVADGSFGLNILSVTPEYKFGTVGSFPVSTTGRAYDVAKNGDYIYLAARKDGLIVVDVSAPAAPSLVLAIVEPDPADASKVIEPSFFHLQGDKLYVSAGNYFLIYDVSNPASPVEIGRYTASSPNQHAVVFGNYAYIAGYNKGLRILNISNPASLNLTSETTVSFNVRAIEKVGDIVFLGGDDSGLLYLNVRNPSAPVLLGELELPTGIGGETAPYDMLVWKDFLFVADGDAGVHVVGITNPDSPVLGSNFATMASSNGLYIDGTTLYLADYDFIQSIEIYETTDVDGDGVVDGADVFPNDPTETLDNDNDGEGDNADVDDDNDSVLDVNDAFPFDPTETADSDGDNVGDNTDVFPNDSAESADFDGDGVGDNADLDDDNDGLADTSDELPNDPYNLIQITFDANLNDFPKLDGEQIAWRGYTDKGAPTIYFQDLSGVVNGGNRIDLGVGAGIEGFHAIPSLSNGQVAWRVWNNIDTYKIYLWEGTVGVPAVEITSYSDTCIVAGCDKKFGYLPSFHSVDVQIENGALTWAQYDGNDYEIMFRDAVGVVHQITNNNEQDYEPQLNNGQIAWTGDEAGDTSFDVFFWDGVDTVSPNIINISNDPGLPAEDAHLMNGTIAWSGYTNSTYRRDTHFWNGTDTTIISLPGNDYEPQIDNVSGFVTWHNNDSGKYLIYVWDGYDIEIIDYDFMNVSLKSPFANNGRIAFQGRDNEGPDIFVAHYRIDKDDDGVLNGLDAFPLDPSEISDFDGDGIGDNADLDDDNDGVDDSVDIFPLDTNESMDSDLDGVGDNADFFPNDIAEWDDSDLDGIGDNSDLLDSFSLTPVSSFNTGGQARGIYKDGKYVYVADGTNGLQVFELVVDGTLINISEFKLPAEPGPPRVDVSLRSVAKVGNYLYLAYREKGLYILDITDPINPVEVYRYDTPDRATFIEISGSRMYLSDRFGLLIFDISTPALPVLIGTYNPPTEIERIFAEGNILYAAVYYSGVLVLDVSNAANPVEINMTAIPDLNYVDNIVTPERKANFGIWTVEKDGNYLYIGGEGSGLVVLDASNLTNLTEVTRLDLPDVNETLTVFDQPPLKIQKYGDQLFIADGINGLQVVDISDPTMPLITATYITPEVDGTLWDFYIEDYTLLLGDHFGGMQHLNLSPTLDNDNDGVLNFLDNYVNDITLQ